MADDVLIPADIAQQVSNILAQNVDPSVQQLATIFDPPPPAVVPTIIERVTDIISLGNPADVLPATTATTALAYVADRTFDILSQIYPEDFCNQISNIIKNG